MSTSSNQLIIFGAGEIAEIAHFYFSHDSDMQPVAFSVDSAFIKEERLLGLPVIPFEEVETSFSPAEHRMFIATSYAKLNEFRAQKYAEAKAKGFSLTSYVSSKASIWPGFTCGDNCLILEDNTIQPFVKIGHNVTLWSGNHIGHHSVIGENCFISSHVVVSGGVVIENNCFLGVNSTLRDHVKIGHHCVIGAGSLIQQDAEPYGVYTQSAAERSKVPSNRLRKI